MVDINRIVDTAKKELKEERFRELVEREKERLRRHRSLWRNIFSFKITITRR